MRKCWTRDFLTRRIDRCYLIAVNARMPEKREVHLELARYYRGILASISGAPASGHTASHAGLN